MKHKIAFALLIIYTTLVSTGLVWIMKMPEYIGYDIGDKYECNVY